MPRKGQMKKKPEQLADPNRLYEIAALERQRKEAVEGGDKKGARALVKQGARRLLKEERIEVLVSLAVEGQQISIRQAGEMFGVSKSQIQEDNRLVNDRLAGQFRERGRRWESLLSLHDGRFSRIMRALWAEYERAGQDSSIVSVETGGKDREEIPTAGGKGVPVAGKTVHETRTVTPSLTRDPVRQAQVRAEIILGMSKASDDYIARLQTLGVLPKAPQRVEVHSVLVALSELRIVARAILQAAGESGLTAAQMTTFRAKLPKALNAESHAQGLLAETIEA